MPSSPEILNTDCFIGRIEVDRQFDIEQQCGTDRHIGITAEVKVELEGIGE